MPQPRSPQFGAILFRASERVGQQGQDAFSALGIPLDARKVSIVLALHRHGPLSSSELADRIGHSRQLIEARLKPVVADGFLVSRRDPRDSRKRIYDFAPAAAPIVDEIVGVMADFERVYEALWEELGIDLEQALLKFEAALAERALLERLTDRFPHHRREASA
ncbi:MarR family winged helix-turn-helix transcriptional regulator [uncultured Maricaulis sp.]|uniref:MarR family winged helix-turn-helix transcriptional regulator n=1 Tax=uncultured Maricaulis sp. TaxID=174710 RepID=UPI0026372A4D|nr:MarR family winged helix-turn-helix transcriptional regulator [uncultured Maricaulis sp.]